MTDRLMQPPIPKELTRFSIQQMYLKVAEFKAQALPRNIKNWKPTVNFTASTDHVPLENNYHEATLTIEVTCVNEEKIVYTVTLKQAGVFRVENFSEEATEAVLNGYCMNVLYPYVCEKVANLTTQAGFTPVALNPMNFEALYQRHREELKQKEQKQKEQKSAIVSGSLDDEFTEKETVLN